MFHHSTRFSCSQQSLIRFENPTLIFKHECDISSCLRETCSFSEPTVTQRSGRPTWTTSTIWSLMVFSTALKAHFGSFWITLVRSCWWKTISTKIRNYNSPVVLSVYLIVVCTAAKVWSCHINRNHLNGANLLLLETRRNINLESAQSSFEIELSLFINLSLIL